MELLDILPKEKWVEFALEIQNATGLQTNVMDREHSGVYAPPHTNRICTAIRKNKQAAGRVCSLAQQDIANEAKVLKQPVVEECDAGIVKMVIPIFVGDEFIGSVGACGALEEDAKIDGFHVSKLLGQDEGEIEEMYKSVDVMSADKLDAIAEDINQRLKKIIQK